jgi:hypothetical protein
MKSGYGLRYKPKNIILGVEITSNTGCHDCGDDTYTLSEHVDVPWIVEDELNAAYVKMFSTQWYNAGYKTPVNDYKPEDLEVVKITLKIDKIKQMSIPTFEEYMQQRYNTPGERHYDPGHYTYIMSEYKKHPDSFTAYSLYDLKDLMGIYNG